MSHGLPQHRFTSISSIKSKKALQVETESVTTTLQDLHYIGRMIDDDRQLLSFIRCDGFVTVVERMKCFSNSELVHSAGCCVLLHLFRLDPGPDHAVFPYARDCSAVPVSIDLLRRVENRLVKHDIVEVLTHSLLRFHKDSSLRSFGMALLLRLTTTTSERVSDSIPSTVITALTRHAQEVFFVDLTVELLFFRIKADSRLGLALLDQGILGCLGRLCDTHTGHIRVLRAICTLFFVLCDLRPSCPMLLVHVAKLVRIAKTHLEDVPLILAVCGTLWYVSNVNDDMKSNVANTGAVHLILRVLLRHAASLACVEVATGVLFSLASASNLAVRQNIAANPLIVDALVGAVYLHHDAEDVLGRITASLDLIPEFASFLLEQDEF